MVSIAAFQANDPGSIPDHRIKIFVLKRNLNQLSSLNFVVNFNFSIVFFNR